VVRRRKWVILQAVVLVPFAAIAFSLHQPKKYEASAQVLLSRQNLATSLTGAQDPSVYVQADRIAQTQADVARVPTIAERVLKRLNIRDQTVGDLLAESTVTARQNADFLDFKVVDRDPVRARQLATAYAREFKIFRRDLDTASLQRARNNVQRRINQLERAKAEKSPLYASLVDRDQQLATMQALQTSNAYVVQEPSGAVQVQPKPKRNGILGLALGIVLGLGLAFLWEALDTRVRSAEEIGERLGGMPLLARLPEPARKIRAKNRLVMLAEPTGVQAEAFRMLRTNLEFVRLDRKAKAILFTSAVQQEGKSTTVANLAVALARSGQRVILVDLDLRRPFLDKFFGLEGPGLTQVALGHVPLNQALARVALTGASGTADVNGNGNAGAVTVKRNGNGRGRAPVGGMLEVLPSGPIPPDPGEFVGTHALAGILTKLKEQADIVLIDTPPALQVGDAMTLSSQVDGVIVVTRMNVVRRHMLSELHRMLGRSPAGKLGFVLTAAAEEGGYGYGNSYGYGYGYAAHEETPRQAEGVV
jgi:Mrp family chromosome partitioning ATPase/capsular polysaccharide biosynthesis protein